MPKTEENNLTPGTTDGKNPWQILFFAIILVLILYLFNVFFGNQNNKKIDTGAQQAQKEEVKKDLSVNSPRTPIDKEEMKSDYRSVIDDIKSSFLAIENKNSNKEMAKFSHDSLDKMFKAVVPTLNKPFHLKLTLSLNTINKLSVLNQEDKTELIKEVDRLDGILGEWQ